MTYPGGKNGAGVYQAIINQMPPHRLYIEPFVGAGAILLHKRPAETTYIMDLDGDVLTATTDEARRRGIKLGMFSQSCGLACLEKAGWENSETLIYCDPPYVMRTRSGGRVYKHEMTDAEHARLLAAVKRLNCNVMLTGYDDLLYRAELGDWRRVEFISPTRGGPRENVLWCNFPEPASLHDYRYLGDGYRERERIRKKVGRWQSNFAALPVLERRAILSALQHIETRDPAPPDLAGVDHAPPEPERTDSGTAREGEGSSRAFSPSSSTNGTAGGGELSERARHKAGFPQKPHIDRSGGAPWPPRIVP